MQSKWVTRDGRRVLYLDYSGFKSDAVALANEVRTANLVVCAQREGTVLALVDLRDTVASAAVVELFKKSATETRPYMHRLAVVGITGLKRFLAEMVARVSGQEMRLFSEVDDAYQWLLEGQGDAGEVITGNPLVRQERRGDSSAAAAHPRIAPPLDAIRRSSTPEFHN